MQKPPLFVMAVAVAALLTGSAGCRRMREKAEEEALERATGGKIHVDHDGKGVTVTAADGGGSVAWGAAAKVPDGFPKSVPIYPGAKINSSVTSNDNNGKAGYLVILESSDPPDQLATFYKTNLSGMTSRMDMTSGMGHVMSFESPTDKLVVNITIDGNAAAKKTTASLTVGRE